MLHTLILILTIMLMHQCNQAQESTEDFSRLRKNMVYYQIVNRGISDNQVINAMLKVERHKFVPPNLQAFAYEDRPLSIGYEQTISQPYIVAFMTETLRLKGTSRVLEIGTGSGYQAAILAEICDSVFTIEIVAPLASSAKKVFEKLGYSNISVKTGDGYLGWESKAPFDAIIVTCAPGNIPGPLIMQLAEGGKMIIPVGGTYVQELVLLEKRNGKIKKSEVLSVRFVPMLNEKGKRY